MGLGGIIFGLLAIAVLDVLMFTTFNASLDDRLATLELPPVARQQLEKVKLGAMGTPEGVGGARTRKMESCPSPRRQTACA